MNDDEKKKLLAALDALLVFTDDANTADHYHAKEHAERKIKELRKAMLP